MMEIEFVILADYVEAVNNKLYMMGGAWNQVSAASYPANHRMGIAVGLLLDENEPPQRVPLRLSIFDVVAERPALPELTIEVGVQVAEPGAKSRALVAI